MGVKLAFKKMLIDPDTGEYLPFIAFVPEAKDKDFAKVFKLFSEKLLMDLTNKAITGGELKILAWFLAKTVELPFQSDMWIPVKYSQLAEEVQLHEKVVQQYIKKLVQKGYLEQFRNRQTIFRLKPEYVYKGVLVKLKESEPEVDF